MIKFGDEHLRLSKGTCGVYKIIINDKWFYIGSSVDLKRRLSTWKHYLSNPSKYKKNRSIVFVTEVASDVRFEILEFITNGSNPKIIEDGYIKRSFNNENCLNLVPDAVNGKGRKLPLGVIRRDKKLRGKPTPSKPIAQFNLLGNFIMSHKSIGAAARYVGCKPDIIRLIINGEAGKSSGYTFKQISEDGSFIEPPKFIKRHKPGKLFHQIGMDGKTVASFTSVQKAALAVGGSRRNIQKVLKCIPKYKTVKGYFFKYA